MKLYLAGPLYNEQERSYNKSLTKVIEGMGYNVFLPQRDGKIAYDQIRVPSDAPWIRKQTYLGDVAEILDCDCMVANLNGIVTDPGTCIEIGQMRMRHTLQSNLPNFKRMQFIVGLHTDYRVLDQYGISLMVQGALDHLFTAEEKLLEYLHRYIKQGRTTLS